jgi:hypothetical protein
MKRIKNKAQLREEKLRLRVEELEMQHTLRSDWADIKRMAQPKEFLKNQFGEQGEAHWLVRGLSTGAEVLSKQLLHKAEEAIEHQTEKGIDYIGRRLQGMLKRKK